MYIHLNKYIPIVLYKEIWPVIGKTQSNRSNGCLSDVRSISSPYLSWWKSVEGKDFPEFSSPPMNVFESHCFRAFIVSKVLKWFTIN